MTNKPKIYIAAEHCGVDLKQFLMLNAKFEIIDLYPVIDSTDDYSKVAKIMIDKLESKPESLGIVICGSGQGISIAMNRSSKIRCVNPRNIIEAKATREHNNANCLSFGAQNIEPKAALEILKTFIKTAFSTEPRHRRRVEQLGNM